MGATKKLSWKSIIRQSTGSHPLDSGGDNGRHWQRPLPQNFVTLSTYKPNNEITATIPLHAFLENHFEIDARLTGWLRRTSAKQERYGYSEYAEILECDESKNRFRIKLKTGETVNGYCYYSDSNGGFST